MKKFFIILLTVYPLTLHSQNSLSVGALAGINVNFYTGTALIESKRGFGPVFGGFIESMSVPNWGFLGRILYEDKRGSFTSQDTNSQGQLQNNDNKINLSYLTIDAMFEYKFPVGLSFHGGPSMGFAIHGTNEKTSTLVTSNTLDTGVTSNGSGTAVKEDITDLSRRLGIKLGLAFDIAFSKKFGLVIQSSLDWSFSKVKEDFGWRIRSWQTVLGLKFSLGRQLKPPHR